MKLWLITQGKNNGYDTYDSAVVAAESEEAAKQIHPDGRSAAVVDRFGSWTSPEFVSAEEIGWTDDYPAGSVICASFNAG